MELKTGKSLVALWNNCISRHLIQQGVQNSLTKYKFIHLILRVRGGGGKWPRLVTIMQKAGYRDTPEFTQKSKYKNIKHASLKTPKTEKTLQKI